MKAKKPKPVKRIRWHCTKCRRRGTVHVETDESLQQLVSDIHEAHEKKTWGLNCPEFTMHVTIPEQSPFRQLCPTHPNVNYRTAWGCPECVREMRAEIARLKAELLDLQRRTVERFCEAVEREAESNMLKTGKLEGAHCAAMRRLRDELRRKP